MEWHWKLLIALIVAGIATALVASIGISFCNWITFFLVFIVAAYKLFEEPPVKHYCAACGQYIGTTGGVCGRCGSNRYTIHDPGAVR